jgi:Fic family protein
MTYNWQHKDWPKFKYDIETISAKLEKYSLLAGKTLGMWEALPINDQQSATIEMIVREAMKTSEIESEYLSRADVVASVIKNLGLGASTVKDPRSAGIAGLLTDVYRRFDEPLTSKMLFEWHRLLMTGNHYVTVGQWRQSKEPMQIVSGTLGKEIIHFVAPPSEKVESEMDTFLQWYQDTLPGGKDEIIFAPVRSAIAHVYFETIHPFEDGNGRIGRAISEKILSEGLGHPALISISAVIESDKRPYYEALKQAQTTIELTQWLDYFVDVILKAQEEALQLIRYTIDKTKFLDNFSASLNKRQRKVILKMLDFGRGGFEGGMTAKKYSSITRCSKATATRDLQELVSLQALTPTGGGRSRSYQLPL